MIHRKNMRPSQIALLSALGISALFVIILVGLSRNAISHVETSERDEQRKVDYSDRTSSKPELKEFRSVTLEGTWEVELNQGDRWEVELSYPEDLEGEIEVKMENDSLILGSGNWHLRDWSWLTGDKDKSIPTAHIIMPELNAVDIKGTTDFAFSGFEGEHLDITISGAGNVEGEKGNYEKLTLTMSGAGNVEVGDVKFINAEVNISGAGNVELTMDGGVLSGNLSGFGNVSYSGIITAERINVSGFGNVEYED